MLFNVVSDGKDKKDATKLTSFSYIWHKQVVEQESSGYQDEDLDIDGIHRGILERALEKLKEGKDRSEILEETVDALELI